MRGFIFLVILGCRATPPPDEYVASLDATGRERLRAILDGAAEKRAGVITRGGKPQTLVGPELRAGQPAPPFRLVSPQQQPVRSEDFRGAPLVLSVVPSVDTPVCEAQTGRMAQLRARLPAGVRVLTVSRDLPHAQRRFLEENRFDTQLASDHRDGSFGRAFGLHVEETGLLGRSVWVIGGDGVVRYRELVRDQGKEPDYDALVAAVGAVGTVGAGGP
jgi:thiol peroxidase